MDGDVSFGHNADEKDDKGDGYRIVHCGNSKGCKNVGVVIEKNGRRRIALTESPLVVKETLRRVSLFFLLSTLYMY